MDASYGYGPWAMGWINNSLMHIFKHCLQLHSAYSYSLNNPPNQPLGGPGGDIRTSPASFGTLEAAASATAAPGAGRRREEPGADRPWVTQHRWRRRGFFHGF